MQYVLSASINLELNVSIKSDEGADQLPKCPKNLPFPPEEANISRLKDWLLEHFANTAFKNNGLFPPMSGPAADIRLKEEEVPKARQNPIPVPFRF